ncbi:MAG: Gldg family protein [Anaerolineaceae bacterium]|nr:Gldg family protein [Anaerolineaceae bacterium]
MSSRLRRFAPILLYLAVAAALISLGLLIVQRQFSLPLQVSLGAMLISLAGFAILDPARIRLAFTGRQARYGSNALIMSLAFIGILIVINYLVHQNNQRWDLTADKTNTLSPETIHALQSMPAPIHADAFFTNRTPSTTARSLLENFKANSKGKFDFTFIDPEADPVSAQKMHITQDGTIALQMGGQQQLVTSPTEVDLVSALVRLTAPGSRTAYFLTGHGERDPNSADQNGLSSAKAALEGKGYSVKSLNLIASPQIPSDAKVVIIAGPSKPVTENEVKLISNYLDKGGSLIVMEEPLPVTDFGNATDPIAEYLAATWNIRLGADFVIDRSVNPPTVAAASEYGSSPITDRMKTTVTVFPTARSVTEAKTGSDARVIPVILVKTAPQSWAETNFTDLAQNKADYNAGQDLIGPVPIAASAQIADKANARVVVIGDSDFASNAANSEYANNDFFINSVDWAAHQDNLINITPKTPTNRIMLPPQTYSMNLILFGAVFVLPGLVVISGIVVWVQRRRRG